MDSTIQLAQFDKVEMEKLLLDIVNTYEKKHNVEVLSVDLTHTQYCGDSKNKVSSLELEIRL